VLDRDPTPPPTSFCRPHGRSEQASTQRTMRTRSQGLSTTVVQDLDRDLLLAATSKTDLVVQRLVKRYRCCITFRPSAGLNAWRNQILQVMLPSDCIVASASAFAPPSPPPPAPLALSVSATLVPDEFIDDPCDGVSVEREGLPRPLTCDSQCAGCLTLQSENARLQQAEQDALARVEMLEAELQYVRSQPLDGGLAEDADTVASTVVDDSALIAEPLIASAIGTPPPPSRAQSWQVVVRDLPCTDNIVTTAVLHSAFSQFCCGRLGLQGDMSMHVMRVLTSRPGTAAGVVALRSQEDYEALFGAARRRLTAACTVSIAPSRPRAQRRALGEARQLRRLRRAGVPRQRAGAAGGRAGSAIHPPMHSSLRHDAPEFVPESEPVSSQPVSLPCPTAVLPHAVHQE
jgi:hypothetical protein